MSQSNKIIAENLAVTWVKNCFIQLEKSYKTQGKRKYLRALISKDDLSKQIDQCKTLQQQLTLLESAFKEHTIHHLRKQIRDDKKITDKELNPDQTQYSIYASYLVESKERDHTRNKMLGALLQTIYKNYGSILQPNKALMEGIKSFSFGTIAANYSTSLAPAPFIEPVDAWILRLKKIKLELSKEISDEKKDDHLVQCRSAIFNAMFTLTNLTAPSDGKLFSRTVPGTEVLVETARSLKHAKSLLNPDKQKAMIERIEKEIAVVERLHLDAEKTAANIQAPPLKPGG